MNLRVARRFVEPKPQRRPILEVVTKPSCALLLIWGMCGACACSSSPSAAASTQPDAGNSGTDAPSGSLGCDSQAGVDSYAAGMKKAGAAGLYSFQLVSSMPAPPALDNNQFVVQVTEADGTPVNGQLSVALVMPQHGHPSPDPPVITFDAASKAFTLDPMNLFMVGLWKLTFSFTPDSGEAGAAGTDGAASTGDSAVFEFCID